MELVRELVEAATTANGARPTSLRFPSSRCPDQVPFHIKLLPLGISILRELELALLIFHYLI